MGCIPGNKKEFDYCGITKWHELGYYGENISVAELEPVCDSWIFDGLLNDPFQIGIDTFTNKHGQKVLDIIHQVAPKANLYTLPTTMTYTNGIVKGIYIDKVLPYIFDNNIDIVSASLFGNEYSPIITWINKIIANGTIFVACAGNTGKTITSEYVENNRRIAIGALHYTDATNKIARANYSSIGSELDFMCFSNLYIHDATVKGKAFGQSITGTSFSTPMFSGMCALVQEFFHKNCGKKLNQSQMYQFCIDHSEDFGEVNRDDNFGYGLFILPDPSTIDIDKYIGDEEMVITLTIGSKTATVDGKKVTLIKEPIIIDGVTMIPIRFISENMGMNVSYTTNAITKKVETVTITD